MYLFCYILNRLNINISDPLRLVYHIQFIAFKFRWRNLYNSDATQRTPLTTKERFYNIDSNVLTIITNKILIQSIVSFCVLRQFGDLF